MECGLKSAVIDLLRAGPAESIVSNAFLRERLFDDSDICTFFLKKKEIWFGSLNINFFHINVYLSLTVRYKKEAEEITKTLLIFTFNMRDLCKFLHSTKNIEIF